MNKDPLKGLTLKKVRTSEQPCWTRPQVERILQASTGWHRDAMTMLAETGLRVGEAKWLTWDDIEDNVIRVRPKDGWRPKTGDQRAIPISPILQDLLKKLTRTSRWVLPAPATPKDPQRGRQFSERRLLQYLKRVLKKLGLPGHVHTFRHSFISHALIQGIPEAILRKWVGHVDADVLRQYTHIHDQASQLAMQQLSAAGPTKATTASRRRR